MDQAGLDTALARFLDREGRLPRETLVAALREARARRALGEDLALALTLVERRLMTREQVGAALAALEAGAPLEGDASARLGPYRALRELGRGGMGVVHEVEREGTRERYALKRLYPGAARAERERFAREFEVQLGLDHPGLVRVRAADLARPDPYLVLDLMPRGSLADRLRGQGPLAPDEARRLGRELARALAYLHERGVLHRDLKPQNVLFDGAGRARLSDFGLARLRGALTLTATGELLGTPAYMAPEQVEDSRAVDARADVYSLGAVLYEALSGRPPFRGATPLAVLDAALHEAPPPLSELVPGCPQDLARACERALAKLPSERPQSARELARLLGEEHAPRPWRRWVRVAGLVVIAGASALTSRWLSAPPQPSEPETASSVAPSPTLTPTPSPGAPSPGAPSPPQRSPELLARALQLQEADATPGELFPWVERAIAAADDEEGRAGARLVGARLAYARGDDARVITLTEGLRAREALYYRANSLARVWREAEGMALLEELSGGADRWARIAEGMMACAAGREPVTCMGDIAQGDGARRDPIAATVVARFHLARQQPSEAVRALEAVDAERSPLVTVQLALAEALLHVGSEAPRIRRLLERIDRLTQPSPPPDYYFARARLAAAERDRRGMIDDLRLQLRRDPWPGPALALGVDLDIQGRWAEAMAVFREAALADPAAYAKLTEAYAFLPRRLRMQRAAGLVGPVFLAAQGRATEAELLGPTARWIEEEVARLPAAARAYARGLLQDCARGATGEVVVDALRVVRGARTDRATLLFEARVALGRDRLPEARRALEAARALGGDGPELALLRAEVELRGDGMVVAGEAFAEVARRWPGAPEAEVARAFVGLAASRGLVREAPPGGEGAPYLADCARVLHRLYFKDLALAVEDAGRLLDQRGLADVFALRLWAYASSSAALARQEQDPAVWERVFLGFELAMQLGDAPPQRLNAAEVALLLGPERPWVVSAPVWLEEVERALPSLGEGTRQRTAERLQVTRGLEAVVGGASEEEVLRRWVGLTLDSLPPRVVEAFGRRFGRPPALPPR
ncbi:MAG: protein kinase [Planctomycetota bacterium]